MFNIPLFKMFQSMIVFVSVYMSKCEPLRTHSNYHITATISVYCISCIYCIMGHHCLIYLTNDIDRIFFIM